MKDKQINLGIGNYSLFSTLKSIALLCAFFIMLKMYFGERTSRIEQELLIEASTDVLQTWKNKNGESLAKIQVLETRNKRTFLAFKSQDSTIIELQKLVKDNKKLFKDSKSTAGIIKSETNIDATAVTTVTEKESPSPIYTSSIVDKWYEAKIVAKADSTNLVIKTFHSISLVMGREGQGFLKKKKSFAVAKDSNPNSNIKDMRIYNIVEDTKRFVIGPYIGIGTGGSLSFQGQIGIGITYKLFEF